MSKAAEKLNWDIHELVSEITEDLREAADKTGDEAAEAMRRSSKALRKAAKRLGEELKETGQEAAEQVKTHPIATAAVIASAAALIGFALSRRGGSE